MNEFNLTPMLINKEFISKIVEHREYNKMIYEYYIRLSSEVKSKKEFWSILNRADRLKACNSIWHLDSYVKSKIKDFKKTDLCRDRFCANCKKVRQAQRINNYLDLFQQYDDDLYFITLTVPNCSGKDLRSTIKRIYLAFDKLIRYFKKETKLFDKLGLDFGDFKGALRSLEVSFKTNGRNKFHPHIHCAFILQGYSPGKEYLKNRYSVDHRGRRMLRLFNRETIKLQKIWKLLIDGQKVTNDAIRCLDAGYSVTIDKFKSGQYKEMFKYMVKDKDMDGHNMDYSIFKVLFHELKNIRQLQGTGVFKKVVDDLDFSLDDEVDSIYNMFMFALKQKELPVCTQETPESLLNDSRNIIISRKKIFAYLRKSVLEDKFSVNDFISNDNYSLLNYDAIDSLLNDLVLQDNLRAKAIRVELENDFNFMSNPKYTVI